MARLILDNPPPLTPPELRGFPFEVVTFPFATLQADAGLTAETASTAPERSGDEGRVE